MKGFVAWVIGEKENQYIKWSFNHDLWIEVKNLKIRAINIISAIQIAQTQQTRNMTRPFTHKQARTELHWLDQTPNSPPQSPSTLSPV